MNLPETLGGARRFRIPDKAYSEVWEYRFADGFDVYAKIQLMKGVSGWITIVSLGDLRSHPLTLSLQTTDDEAPSRILQKALDVLKDWLKAAAPRLAAIEEAEPRDCSRSPTLWDRLNPATELDLAY